MITYLKGDLFNSPAQVLVNTVNTVGVMGKGIALEFKKRYPEMFLKYQKVCADNSLDVGKLFLWMGAGQWILLFPTKKHWRNPSQPEFIELGLKKFADNWQRLGIESIAFPRLGCGNGGLDWEVVRPIMEKYLKPLPIQVFIYLDNYADATPEHQQPDITEQWLHRTPDAIGYNIVKEDLQRLLDRNDTITFADGTTKRFKWEGDLLHITNGETITVSDAEFCNVWDYVRDSGVFTLEALPEHLSAHPVALLELLKRLDYLQEVIVSKNGKDFAEQSNGYQYLKRA